MKKVSVLAPATVANMVCGFDILGFALDEPSDLMTVRIINEKKIEIIHRDDFNLPTEATKNVAGVALLAMLEKIEENIGFEIKITKKIKPGSGIGSSAASAAGAVVAANHLLNNRFTKPELIEFAMSGEELASGSKHADNVAPCVLGGVILVRSNEPLDVIKLDFPELFVTIVHPQIEVKTSDAREILKQQVLLKDAIKQWGNVAGLVAGLMKKDYELISRSLEDRIIEPTRSILIPKFDRIKTESKRAGALGGGISGSGPSIFMLSRTEEIARTVEDVMRQNYQNIELEFNIYVTKINSNGVSIV
ncbi:MAG: homoserine kinase [Acidobacteriota bacterium]|jgi:homoserine kinase|nr:homoserine kinase [Acidobacteriota bacterium]